MILITCKHATMKKDMNILYIMYHVMSLVEINEVKQREHLSDVVYFDILWSLIPWVWCIARFFSDQHECHLVRIKITISRDESEFTFQQSYFLFVWCFQAWERRWFHRFVCTLSHFSWSRTANIIAQVMMTMA